MQLKEGSDRIHQLYLDVLKRGPGAFSGLVKSLADSGNGEAAKCLDPNVELPPPPQPPPSTSSVPRERFDSIKLRGEELLYIESYPVFCSKVWHEPTYDDDETAEVRISEAAKDAPNDGEDEVEYLDDRMPITVKVKPANQYRGPPQFKVRELGMN